MTAMKFERRSAMATLFLSASGKSPKTVAISDGVFRKNWSPW